MRRRPGSPYAMPSAPDSGSKCVRRKANGGYGDAWRGKGEVQVEGHAGCPLGNIPDNLTSHPYPLPFSFSLLFSCVKFILKSKPPLEDIDEVGGSALHWATVFHDHHPKLLGKLLRHYPVNVNTKDALGRTPLMMAEEPKAARILLCYGADPSLIKPQVESTTDPPSR